MNNLERNSTEQENNAQIHSSINMEETRTDGQAVIKENVMPTEQASVQLPTAEGDVDQKNEVPQPINESHFVLGRWYGINGEVVDPEDLQDEVNETISTEQEEDVQASAGTSPTQNNSKKKDYKPKYSDEELLKLTPVTEGCEQEIARAISDPNIGAVPYANGSNCLIDLRKVHPYLYTPQVNRLHGTDQKKTGDSLMSYGSQHLLLVVTVKMAVAAGLVPVQFGNAPDKSQPISEHGFVLLDGNGRINYLMGIPVDEWPEVYAVFPTKDAAGFYDLNKIFDIINTQVSVWKTQDMVQKRLLMDAAEAHPGWNMIQELRNKGYKYQAACQLATLDTDRINKTRVTTGDANDVFSHYGSAKKIFDVLVVKFGEETDTLKTKEFTKGISALWKMLQKKYGDDLATEYFLDFLSNSLADDKVKEINEAKSVKGGISKDEKRKTILNNEFSNFIGSKNLNLD